MRLKRAVIGVLLATTPACVITRRVAPVEYLSQYQPTRMLVVDSLGRPIMLEQPEIVGDNVVGYRSGVDGTISVPVAQVQEALVKQKSTVRTALLVGALIAAGGFAAIATATGGSAEPCRLVWDVSDELPLGRAQCDTLGPDGGPLEPYFF
jgi:hypothetical protein